MISFPAVIERALNGPICTERDFELGIFVPNLRKAVQKYDIKYDPRSPVPADDDLADRVWEAAIEFLIDTGVYCLDTERRILFTREEIEGALETGPSGRVFGEGKDAKVMPRRIPEDKTPPWCSGGGGSCPVSSEWIFLNMVKACAENPLTDSINTACLTNIDGREIVAGSPLGIEGAIRNAILTREALRRAGRPGMPIVNAIGTAIQAQEHIAGHAFGIRNTDAQDIGTIHEMKINFESLNRVAYSLAEGCLIFAANGPILGGLCGGAPGVAVATAAYNPIDLLLLRASVQHPFPTHFELGTTCTRDLIWVHSLANQAITRNSSLPVVSVGYSVAGPATKTSFYEFAAWAIGTVVSGGSIEVAAPARGANVDHCTPMEAVFTSEVAHAVVGMIRKDANNIVVKLLAKYEDQLRNPPMGKRYQECYDVTSGRPKKEFIQLYQEARQEMTDNFGLYFQNVTPYI